MYVRGCSCIDHRLEYRVDARRQSGLSICIWCVPELIEPTKNVFQVLTLLYIWVAVRNIYQGLIINKHRTAWMTFSSSIRIIVMLPNLSLSVGCFL
jgi:hypothetical protein